MLIHLARTAAGRSRRWLDGIGALGLGPSLRRASAPNAPAGVPNPALTFASPFPRARQGEGLGKASGFFFFRNRISTVRVDLAEKTRGYLPQSRHNRLRTGFTLLRGALQIIPRCFCWIGGHVLSSAKCGEFFLAFFDTGRGTWPRSGSARNFRRGTKSRLPLK